MRYFRNLVNARATTLRWLTLTIGEGEAAIGRQSQPFPPQRLLALPMIYRRHS